MTPETTSIPSLSRRGLLRGAGAAAAALGGAALLPGRASAHEEAECVNDPDDRPGQVGTNLPKELIGAQMFSVADEVDARGWAGVLPAMAEIGYDEIEFAGHNGADPAEIRRILDDNGLTAIGNHGSMDEASIEAANILGQPYTGIAVLIPDGFDTAGWQATCERLNEYGERCAASGVKFYIHLHGPEYVRVLDDPTRFGMDLLLEHTDPRYVFFEMDIFWAYFFASWVGGLGSHFDPIDWVVSAPERFPLFHVKDGKEAAQQAVAGQEYTLMYEPIGQQPGQEGICDVGQGDIPFKEFFGALPDLTRHHFIWERDTASSNPHGSLTSARASYLMMHFDHMAGPSEY